MGSKVVRVSDSCKQPPLDRSQSRSFGDECDLLLKLVRHILKRHHKYFNNISCLILFNISTKEPGA